MSVDDILFPDAVEHLITQAKKVENKQNTILCGVVLFFPHRYYSEQNWNPKDNPQIQICLLQRDSALMGWILKISLFRCFAQWYFSFLSMLQILNLQYRWGKKRTTPCRQELVIGIRWKQKWWALYQSFVYKIKFTEINHHDWFFPLKK